MITTGAGHKPQQQTSGDSGSAEMRPERERGVARRTLLLSGVAKNKKILHFALIINISFEQIGDVEVNPGPFPPWKKDEEVENLQKIIDDQEDEIVDLKDLVDKQRDDIDNLREKLEDLLSKANEIRNEL